MSEAETINKLILLYLLDQASFPLTNSQISEFLVSREYMQYFPLQALLAELESTGFLESEKDAMQTVYRITPGGHDTVGYFSDRLSDAIRQEIRDYLRQNHVSLRVQSDLHADYYRTTSGEYAVHSYIREGDSELLDLTVTVPSEDDAERFALNWKEKAQAVYAAVMKELMR